MTRVAAVAAALYLVPVLPQGVAAQQTPPPATPPAAAQAVAVRAVEVEGSRRVGEDQIRAGIGIQAGDSIQASDVHSALARLWGTMQFRNVEAFADPDPTDPGGPVTLRFRVEEQPLVANIEFRGLENVRASVIRDTVGLRPGRPYEPRRAAEAEAMTRQMLAQKGFRVRSIEHRLEPVEGSENEVRLVFDVEEGLRVAISDIEFTGNTVFSNDRLRGVMSTKSEGFLWTRTGMFDEDRLREDLRGALPAFYAENGYIDFAVVGDSLVVDPVTGKARLVVEVEEGQQYRLAEFDVRGASRFASEDLRRCSK